MTDQPLSPCRELQCTGQIRPPPTGAEPRLVQDRAPLAQHWDQPGGQTRAAQVPGGRRRDPAHRIVTARSRRGTGRRHGDEQEGDRTARPPRPGPYTTRQGPPERPRKPECPSLLVGQQNRTYGVLVRRRRVHRRKPRGPGRGTNTAGRGAVHRGSTGRAQLGARSAAACAGHRQDQIGQLPPHAPHEPTVPGPGQPDHPCGQLGRSPDPNPGPGPDQPGPEGISPGIPARCPP